MPQWNFVGSAYKAANPYQDDQHCINWFVEVDPNEPNDKGAGEAKTVLGLLGTPGLQSLNSSYSGEYRGGWVLPGGMTALLVVGSSAILATFAGNPANTPVFTFSTVGTLATSSGRVNIRDNGAGKIAVFVDGTTNLYAYNVGTGVFATVSDPAFLGATNVAEFDGWFFFNQPGTQKFFSSPNYWNGTAAFDATYFALKDNAPDNLVTLIETNRELWLIGEATTEPWYNAGNATFPLSRIEGAMQQIGCAAAQSVVRTGKGLIWLARSERGGNSVIMTQGYAYNVISTPAVSWALNQYQTVSDAIGYIYTEEGHEFYVLILPAADATWVYDLTTGEWHRRASFSSGTFHRQKINGLIDVSGVKIGGDYTNGKIYWQSRTLYADDDQPLVAVRRASHVWDKADRARVIHSSLQIEFRSGAGLTTGQGSDPQAMLRWKNENGQWGNEHWAAIGQIGETGRRTIWRRLGRARDRVYEVRVSDPVNRDVVGASLKAGATTA
jgi:hypothetical protein